MHNSQCAMRNGIASSFPFEQPYIIRCAHLYYILINQSFNDHFCFLTLNPEGSRFLESGCKITAFIWTDQIFSHFFSIFFVRG